MEDVYTWSTRKLFGIDFTQFGNEVFGTRAMTRTWVKQRSGFVWRVSAWMTEEEIIGR
jgi:hypothetical protein